MHDAWWYIWNFLLGSGTGIVVIVVFMKMFVFLLEKLSDNPE